MIRYLYFITGLALQLLINNVVRSQTSVTINYLTSNLSQTECNVFHPPLAINTVSHQSHAGGVSFNPNDGIVLWLSPMAQPQQGTAFVINYNFEAGYKYDISFTAKGRDEIKLKASVVPNLNSYPTGSTSSCSNDYRVSGYNTAGIASLDAITSTTSSSYSIPEFEVQTGSNYPFLIVWATGGRLNASLDALTISSITIVKTAFQHLL